MKPACLAVAGEKTAGFNPPYGGNPCTADASSSLPCRDARCSSDRPTASARSRWRPCSASAAPRKACADTLDPIAPRAPHFPAKAKGVIFLFMDGGPSHMDTFDPKPRLDREHGQPIKMKVQPTQFNNVGNVLKSPWKFRNYGESGIPVSDLFPNVGACVDDLAIIRSMVSDSSEHTAANYFMHTGSILQGRPSHGSWATYGLGSLCQGSAGFRRPEQRPDPPRRGRLLQQRVPARVVSGLDLQGGRRADREPQPDRDERRRQAPEARAAAVARP